jgi:hypothetical protein
VNLEKLAKQLRRDMAANPKKAAALGLMLLVALYFWGPLIANWAMAGGSKRSAKMSTANLILTDDPAEVTQQMRARSGGKFRWERARQLMLQDRAMTSAAFDPMWVDPFAKSAQEIVLEQPSEAGGSSAEQTAAMAPIAADALDLVLGGVFIGSKNRVATINGEAWHEGDMLVVTGREDKSITQKVRVLQIRRQGVTLEVAGGLVTLQLSTPSLAQGDEIQKKKPPLSN